MNINLGSPWLSSICRASALTSKVSPLSLGYHESIPLLKRFIINQKPLLSNTNILTTVLCLLVKANIAPEKGASFKLDLQRTLMNQYLYESQQDQLPIIIDVVLLIVTLQISHKLG